MGEKASPSRPSNQSSAGNLFFRYGGVPRKQYAAQAALSRLLGAEFELVENLNLFGEYGLVVSIIDSDLIIDLGLGNSAQIGIIVYLN